MSTFAAKRTAAQVGAYRQLGIARRRRRMPRQHPPVLLEKEFGLALAREFTPARRAWAPLLSVLPGWLETAARTRRVDSARDDATTRDILAMIAAAEERVAAAATVPEIERLAETFAVQTATYQRIQLSRQTQAALGIDVFAPDRALAVTIESFVAQNVTLIRGLSTKQAERITSLVLDAGAQGKLWSQLGDDLEQEIGFPERRAQFIGRDQLGKFYGQVNAQRQVEIGVRKFTWRTSNDERVRHSHRARNGRIYTYENPRGANGALPGEEVLCRCTAEPVFDDILDALDD